jgi:hypothetical protein
MNLILGKNAVRRQNNIGKIAIIVAALVFLAFFATHGHAQTAECPPDKVCISPDAAKKALQDSDAKAALEAENTVLRQSIDDLKKVITDLKVELARTTGQLTGEQAANIQNRAIIELLLKSVRPKKFGLINF